MKAQKRGVWTKSFQPILLKRLAVDCGITQPEMAQAVGESLHRTVSRPTINVLLNRGQLPSTMPSFPAALENFINTDQRAMAWLTDQGFTISDIWQPLGEDLRMALPSGHSQRSAAGRSAARPGMIPGDPDALTIKEVEMITHEARRHFKLFRDPFPANGGVEKEIDIYMSDEHRYIEAAMLDAAKHSGLLAIVGQVGSGKTVMRKRVFDQLRKEGGIQVVFPQIIDKERITSGTLCDAIIMDVSDQKPKIKHEQKARQVKHLLMERSRNGDRCCLVIEEAHNLTVHAFKTLKQLWELEDGYNKLISIILIGQTELGDMLDERHHPEMREVIRRIQVANIQGLNGNLREYLDLKFRRVGAKLDDIITPEAIDALSQRLTSADERGRKISHAYPLSVNLYTVRAINLAHEMGEAKVTAEVVEAI